MLHINRAARADHLVEALCDLLAEPLSDPFATEVIAVHTRGMERWLAQSLSGRLGAGEGRSDGVCANVTFPSPGRLSRDAVAVASGIEPDTDPWLSEHLLWFVINVVDDHIDEEWLADLAAYIRGPDGSGARRTRGPTPRGCPPHRRALRPLRAVATRHGQGLVAGRKQRRRRKSAAGELDLASRALEKTLGANAHSRAGRPSREGLRAARRGRCRARASRPHLAVRPNPVTARPSARVAGPGKHPRCALLRPSSFASPLGRTSPA